MNMDEQDETDGRVAHETDRVSDEVTAFIADLILRAGNPDPFVHQQAISELVPWVDTLTDSEREKLAEATDDGLQGELWV